MPNARLSRASLATAAGAALAAAAGIMLLGAPSCLPTFAARPAVESSTGVVDSAGMVVIAHGASGNRSIGELRYYVECVERAWALTADEPASPIPLDVEWTHILVPATEIDAVVERIIAAEDAGTWVPCPAGPQR